MKPLLLVIPEFFGISIEVYFIILILAVPFFFFWRWLFRRWINSKALLTITAWVTALFTAPFVYVFLVLLWIGVVSYYPRNDFDRSKWLANIEKRYQLSESIIESKMLVGKTKLEVKQLLGKSESADESEHWRYYLGFKPSMFGIDPDVLDVHFKDGKVIEVSQYET